MHAHYGLTGAVAAVQRRVPLVTTFHGSDYNGWSTWQRRVSWIVARRSTRSSRVTTDAGPRSPSATVIPCGVDTELFTPIDRGAARRTLGWQEDASTCSSPAVAPTEETGRPLRRDLVEARKAMPPLCDVPWRACRATARARPERSRRDAHDVRREGSPVAVRESLACMTPVVSVDVGDVVGVRGPTRMFDPPTRPREARRRCARLPSHRPS